jgi:hypothetical protein
LLAGSVHPPPLDTEQGNIQLWDAVKGKALRRFAEARSLGEPGEQRFLLTGRFAFSADSRTMAVESVRQEPLWDTREKMDPRPAVYRYQVAVELWDVTSGKRLGPVGEPSPPIDSRNWPTGQLEKVGAEAGGFRVRALPGGRYLLLPDYDRTPSPITLSRPDPYRSGPLVLSDAATGKELRRFEDFKDGQFLSAALSPGGDTLAAVGSADAAHPNIVLMIWDVSDLVRACRRPSDYSDDELEGLCDDLASDDAAKANRAMRALAAVPGRAAPLLADRVRPVDAAGAPRLIADLTADDPDVRLKAAVGLTRLGEAARPALEKALAGQPSDETRREVEGLLKKLDGPPPAEEVRGVRAIDVLERIGDAKAREALKALAGGAPESLTTRAAKDALDRLAKP